MSLKNFLLLQDVKNYREGQTNYTIPHPGANLFIINNMIACYKYIRDVRVHVIMQEIFCSINSKSHNM
jgi:hypothetical protein